MTSDRTVKSIQTALLTLVLLLAGAAVGQTPGQMPQSANIPKNMKQYFLCLLTKGDKWTPVQFADPAMQDHLVFIREQIEGGKFVTSFFQDIRRAGPTSPPASPDESPGPAGRLAPSCRY